MKNSTICFDFGNTSSKYGIFEQDHLAYQGTLDSTSEQEVQQLLDQYQPTHSLLSSVIHHDSDIEKVLAKNTKFILLDVQTKLPFTTPVPRPETIGADRLALAAFATFQYPGQHNLVIALGSCITYNFIHKYGWFLGGSISPGMQMRFKSMHDFTALLPLVEPNWNFPLAGYNTRTNLLSGVLLGMAVEIDGIIDKYKEKYLNFNVLLTGGDCSNFVPHLKNKIFADRSMILKGLYAISKYNYENNS